MLKLMLRPVSTMPQTPTCTVRIVEALEKPWNGMDDLQEEQVVVKSSESERGADGRDDQTVPSDRNEEDKEEKDCRNHLIAKSVKCCKNHFTKQAKLQFEPKRGMIIT